MEQYLMQTIIWFSLESLKVLSGTLKMLPARMVCNSNQLKLGVRIYYTRVSRRCFNE